MNDSWRTSRPGTDPPVRDEGSFRWTERGLNGRSNCRDVDGDVTTTSSVTTRSKITSIDEKTLTRVTAVSFDIDGDLPENDPGIRSRRRSILRPLREMKTDAPLSHIIDREDFTRDDSAEKVVDRRSTNELYQYVGDVIARRHDSDGNETEMTSRDKQALYRAVQTGDIDLVDEMLLLLPAADINMTWYSENLLMAAIRTDQQDMALFLLDNNIDRNYVTIRLDVTSSRTRVARYPVKCRQMAYDRGMTQVVDVIDELNGDTWPTINYGASTDQNQSRAKRLRRTVSQLVVTPGECNGEPIDSVDAKQSAVTSPSDVANAILTKRILAKKMKSRTTQSEKIEDQQSGDDGTFPLFRRINQDNDGLDRRHRRRHHHHHVVVAPAAAHESVGKPSTMTSPRDSSNDVNSRVPTMQCIRLSSAHLSEHHHVINTLGNRHSAWLDEDHVQPMSGKQSSHVSRRAASATTSPRNVLLSPRDSRRIKCKVPRRVLSERDGSLNATATVKSPTTGSRRSSSCGSSFDFFVDADPEVLSSVAACRPVRLLNPWKEVNPERMRLLEQRVIKSIVSDISTASTTRETGRIIGTRRQSSLSARQRTAMTSRRNV